MATNIVTNSSENIIVKAFGLLAVNEFPSGKIIADTNSFLHNTISLTDDKHTFINGSINKTDISQYIASSTLSHCFDGWNFLSKALDSLLTGDISTCIHLAYYSELRAAMCILGCEGVGIFNKRHISFDAAETENVFNRNISNQPLTTHKAVDELITEWSSGNIKKDKVFRTIRVNNRTFKDWIDASGHSTSTPYMGAVISDWFDKWSLDLKLDDDQRLRNETSYRPHFTINPVNIVDTIDKLIEIWEGLEPTPSHRFNELDTHFLRLGLETLFELSTGQPITNPSYKQYIDNIFDNLGESKTQHLYNVMLRTANPSNHVLIEEASKDFNNVAVNLSNPLSIISRSILLLRFATGFVDLLISDSSTNINLLNFWWEDIAVKLGLTSVNPSGLTPCDLYTDINDSIISLRSYQASITNLYTTNIYGSSDLSTLKQFQRVCFWGLGL